MHPVKTDLFWTDYFAAGAGPRAAGVVVGGLGGAGRQAGCRPVLLLPLAQGGGPGTVGGAVGGVDDGTLGVAGAQALPVPVQALRGR